MENFNAKTFVDQLDAMHRSQGYKVIRDELTPQMLRVLKESDDYQRFQDIKLECKQSHDHDHTMAAMMDVDRACTVVYGTLLKLMKASNDDMADILGKMMVAINTIEVKVGVPTTFWGDKNDDVETEQTNTN